MPEKATCQCTSCNCAECKSCTNCNRSCCGDNSSHCCNACSCSSCAENWILSAPENRSMPSNYHNRVFNTSKSHESQIHIPHTLDPQQKMVKITYFQTRRENINLSAKVESGRPNNIQIKTP